MTTIKPSFLMRRHVLFVVDPSLGIAQQPYVEVGRVEELNEAERDVLVSFMYHGNKSTVERVPFSHLLAVMDIDHPTNIEMYRFSGYGHDLRGMEPFGSHEMAKK